MLLVYVFEYSRVHIRVLVCACLSTRVCVLVHSRMCVQRLSVTRLQLANAFKLLASGTVGFLFASL